MKRQRSAVRNNVPLLFVCSGGSNAGEVADLAARKLAKDGNVLMSCVSAVSARIDPYLKKLKKDGRVIVLDGCEENCAAKSIKNAGFKGFLHVRMADLGLDRKNTVVNSKTVNTVVDHVRTNMKKRSVWKENAFSYHHSRDQFKKRG